MNFSVFLLVLAIIVVTSIVSACLNANKYRESFVAETKNTGGLIRNRR